VQTFIFEEVARRAGFNGGVLKKRGKECLKGIQPLKSLKCCIFFNVIRTIWSNFLCLIFLLLFSPLTYSSPFSNNRPVCNFTRVFSSFSFFLLYFSFSSSFFSFFCPFSDFPFLFVLLFLFLLPLFAISPYVSDSLLFMLIVGEVWHSSTPPCGNITHYRILLDNSKP